VTPSGRRLRRASSRPQWSHRRLGGTECACRAGARSSRADHNRVQGDNAITETLDAALKERLRAVVRDEPVTEAELRKLAEEGRACELILGGQLQRSEQRLEALAADPNSSLVDIAGALREVNELRPDLDELEALLGELQLRAREFRARWAASPGS
jgi:chromosome segregation ATPase